MGGFAGCTIFQEDNRVFFMKTQDNVMIEKLERLAEL
jgi:hypothetical protein